MKLYCIPPFIMDRLKRQLNGKLRELEIYADYKFDVDEATITLDFVINTAVIRIDEDFKFLLEDYPQPFMRVMFSIIFELNENNVILRGFNEIYIKHLPLNNNFISWSIRATKHLYLTGTISNEYGTIRKATIIIKFTTRPFYRVTSFKVKPNRSDTTDTATILRLRTKIVERDLPPRRLAMIKRRINTYIRRTNKTKRLEKFLKNIDHSKMFVSDALKEALNYDMSEVQEDSRVRPKKMPTLQHKHVENPTGACTSKQEGWNSQC